MSHLRDAQNEGADLKNFSGQIQSLKKRVSALTQENESLKGKMPPHTNISMNGEGSIVLTETIQQRSRSYNYTQSLEFGKAYKALVPLISPLLQIARASALGRDVYTKRQEAHQLDESGKLTKSLLKDEDGKQIYLPNQRDKAAAVSRILMSDPDCRKALAVIAKRLTAAEELISEKAHSLANSNSSDYQEEDDYDIDL